MLRRRTLCTTIPGAVACALAPACARSLPPSLPTSLFGAAMPSFERVALDGREISSAALRGEVVVVEFFASYCQPCKRSLPALVGLAERDQQATIIAIGEDEARDKTAAMAADFGLTMAVIHDVGNLLAARFRVDGLPITFIADAAGTIRWVGGADQSARQLARIVAAVRRG